MKSESPHNSNDATISLRAAERPRFVSCVRNTFRWSTLVVASPFVAVVLFFIQWLLPNPQIGKVIYGCICLALILPVGVIVRYLSSLFRYYRRVEREVTALRGFLLTQGGVKDAGPTGDFTYAISGIAEQSGTVLLVADPATSSSLRVGGRLNVLVTGTREVLGLVEVDKVVEGYARLRVVDRANAQFWAQLEDRMKTDYSSPQGVHLEPYFSIELRSLLSKG